nr:uncharacterized protein LOC109176388 [Ipomoea trifida]
MWMELLLQMELPRKPPSQKRATVKPIKPEAVIVISPDTKEEVKEKNSLRRKAAAEDSSRKTYTATLTARNKAACGLNIKLPKEKIEDIDAGDVYNELAVVEYAEDIYKFYTEAEVKEKNNLRRRAAAEGSSRKTYTATLTARRKAACGLNIKLPKEKIEDIDAGDE